jgi:hypothetical protein
MTDGKYSIELFRVDAEGTGIECVFDLHDDLSTAGRLHRQAVADRYGPLVMLCDRARVLAHSDRPEAMPGAKGNSIELKFRAGVGSTKKSP